MTFPINVNIPGANNDPADDQPLMQQNYSNINSYLKVDHTNPASTGAGQHLQVTFNSNNVPGAPVDPQSILYTNTGTASPIAQLFWRNQNSIFHMSPIRAWGAFNSGGILASQSFNVVNVSRVAAGQYLVNLTPGCTSSSNYGVLVASQMNNSFSTGVICGYLNISQTQFQINLRSLTGATGVDANATTFAVLQI